MPLDFIITLTRRIEALLPHKTGQSAAEIQMNPGFVSTCDIIIKHQRNHPSLTSYTLEAFAKVLQRISNENKLLEVEKRPRYVLESTLIVTKLLVEAVECVWDRRDSFSSDIGVNHSRFKCYEIPASIDPNIVPEALDSLVAWISSGVNAKAIDLVRHGTSAASRDSTLHSVFVPTPHPDNETQRILLEIDGYLCHVCSFIATANPMDYFKYLQANLFCYAERNEYVPPKELQKYMPLMRLTFYTEENAPLFGEGGLITMRYIRSTTWQQALFVLITVAVQNQSFSRPQDYGALTAQKSVELVRMCNMVFEVVSNAFEASSMNNKCYFFAANWLLMLCVEEFNQLELIDQPREWARIPKNKRLIYLASVLKDAESGKSPECFDSLTKLFHLCSRLKFYNQTSHPIFRFCMRHLDSSVDNLIKYSKRPEHNNNSELMSRIDVLNIELFIAALILKPEFYFSVFLHAFEYNQGNLFEIRPFVNVVRELAASESGRPIFEQLMARLWRSLKSMIMGSVKILRQCEVAIADAKTFTSPGSSSQSFDALSQNSNPRDDSFSSKNRTIFDHYVSKSAPIRFKIADKYDGQSRPALCQQYSSKNPHLIASETPTKSGGQYGESLKYESTLKVALHTEGLLVDLFKIFCAAPHLYFNDPSLMDAVDWQSTGREKIIAEISLSATETSMPLTYAFKTKPFSTSADVEKNHNSGLFEAACSLAILLVDPKTSLDREYSILSTMSNYFASNLVIESICRACLLFSIANSKFKSCFLLINRFLLRREYFRPIIAANESVGGDDLINGIEFDLGAFHAIEKVLLLSMCSQDLQLHSIAKTTMKWYCDQFENKHNVGVGAMWAHENLADTFSKVINDGSVFTGFVSLHKKYRAMLREAKPTMSLYEVWLLMYNRWIAIVDGNTELSDDEMVFKHFSGFLVSISGNFLMHEFAKGDANVRHAARDTVSLFFDKCISLLKSPDLMIRTMIKDVISYESHWAVYCLVARKLLATGAEYCERKIVNEDSIHHFENTLVIIAAMIAERNDGTFVLLSLLNEICPLSIKFIEMVHDYSALLRLRLRFCKLVEAIECERELYGMLASYKVRNIYAKVSADWLEQIVFSDYTNETCSSVLTELLSVLPNREHDLVMLKLDLVVQCSRALMSQLEDNYLEVPEGTKDSDIRKSKDLSFGNYFSLFYKIIQEFSKCNTQTHKARHKLTQIMDNVLKSMSNILQSDTDIGMQFVLPLGYHESVKIRSIFLNVFSNMLMSRTNKDRTLPDPKEHILELADLVDVFGAIAEVASSAEYNLLASSMYGIMSYTQSLDRLFVVLLRSEIKSVSRSTSLLRRNSTLTRVLYYFTKEYGDDYLKTVLKPFIVFLVELSVECEVEKVDRSSDATQVYMLYLNKLVDGIIGSIESVPQSFRLICAQIHACVSAKFSDAALTAVGSFLFLRFFCPAIISPESSLDMPVINPRVKRTLMQLVKVLQMMANGSLSLLRWPALSPVMSSLEVINEKINMFLRNVVSMEVKNYPFESTLTAPIPELRYLHKFIYCYNVDIRNIFVTEGFLNNLESIQQRRSTFCRLDRWLVSLGQPKPTIQLQNTSPFKFHDANNFRCRFNDFMEKMSIRYVEKYLNVQIVQSHIYKDGSPLVVITHRKLKECDYNVEFVVYKMFEIASQFWDGKYHLILDYTEVTPSAEIVGSFASLVTALAPEKLFKNLGRLFMFNVPKENHEILMKNQLMDLISSQTTVKISTLSLADTPEAYINLNLDPVTLAIGREVRVEFKELTVYDAAANEFLPASLNLGRKWLQLCWSDRIELDPTLFEERDFAPLEVFRLADIVKCEVSPTSNREDEFAIVLSDEKEILIRSRERLEILRYLYFTTSRLANTVAYGDEDSLSLVEGPRHQMHWFCRLYNLMFQGLLCDDEEVRIAAETLFGSLSSYFGVDIGIKAKNAKDVSFPANTTAFVVLVLEHLARNFPKMTYRFFKAYLDHLDELPNESKLSSIVYMSPWMENIYEYIFLEEGVNGPERVADLVRQLCRLSAANRKYIAFLNDYVWKKLYDEARLIPILVDEVVAFATDNKNDNADWSFVILIIFPSVETCGEVINRLISCVDNTRKNDSTVPYNSKLFEIKLLIKICSSLFFNSYELSRLFLADIYFVTSLFIDNAYLDFGADLQKLFVNVIQSFLKKPDLTAEQQEVVEQTIEHCTDLRAKMLFGMKRSFSTLQVDAGQLFNSAINFESLCDHLNKFIDALGEADDSTVWRLRWLSNIYKVALSPASIFHRRAIIMVGVLSKLNISDSLACKFLEMVSKIDSIDIETCNAVSFANARIFRGLPCSSQLPFLTIWPYLCYSHVGHVSLFQAVLSCLFSVLLREFDTPGFMRQVMSHRKYLNSYISAFEETYGFFINEENIDFHIFYAFSQGCKVSQFRHLALQSIMEYYKARVQYDRLQQTNDSTPGASHFYYLVFIYLNTEPATFQKYLADIGLEAQCKMHEESTSMHPQSIIDYLARNTKTSNMILIYSSYLFISAQMGNIYRKQLLSVAATLYEKNRHAGLIIFHILKSTLERDVATCNSVEMEAISQVLITLIDCASSRDQYMSLADEATRENGVFDLKECKAHGAADEGVSAEKLIQGQLLHDINLIQGMFHRAANLNPAQYMLED